LTCKTRPRYDL